jgi:NAD(P)H-quinone oxidoreductase subunit L
MNNLDLDLIITLSLYVGLAGTYLLVIPGGMMFYLKRRWYTARSIERLLMYFMVFLFFPGFLLLSIFVNLRPSPREV